MSADERTRLATEQAQLVCALCGRDASPAGFDAERLQVAATGLLTKRRRSVARAWPGLAEALGNRFAERFRDFAASTPLPQVGGPLADGREFVRWLAATDALPDETRFQALAVDLRYRKVTGGLVPRRGPVLKMSLLGDSRRLALALRLPWLGERWFTLPFGRR